MPHTEHSDIQIRYLVEIPTLNSPKPSRFPQLLLDPQQLVILRIPLTPRRFPVFIIPAPGVTEISEMVVSAVSADLWLKTTVAGNMKCSPAHEYVIKMCLSFAFFAPFAV